MKKYSCLSNIVLIVFTMTWFSCEETFIPDPTDPRLPKYTEEGRGTAGAFINDDVWNSIEIPGYFSFGYDYNAVLVLFNNKDSIRLVFEGESNIYKYLVFNLSGLHINHLHDLTLLENQKIQLDGTLNEALCLKPECDVYGTYADESGCNTSGGTGQLWFRNVSINDSTGVVLSGTFGFNSNDPVYGNTEVTYGRFDCYFEKDLNLWVYE